MISKRAIHATSMRSSPMYEHVLTPNRGIDETRPHSDSNHVSLTKNLDVNPDGSLSIRKPLVYMDSWDVNLKYGSEYDAVDVALKCKKVIPTYLPNVKLIVFEREGYKLTDTVPKFWVTISYTDRDGTPQKCTLNLKYSDVEYVERVTEFPTEYTISTEFNTYYGIPVENTYHFIDLSDPKVFSTPTTTVLGNCTVNLTSEKMKLGNAYDPNVTTPKAASVSYRYVQFTQYNVTYAFTLEVKTPEVNEIDPSSDIPLNPNLTLDNPYAIRDDYKSSYTDILGIQAYADITNSLDLKTATSTISYTNSKTISNLCKFKYQKSDINIKPTISSSSIAYPTPNTLVGATGHRITNLKIKVKCEAHAITTLRDGSTPSFGDLYNEARVVEFDITDTVNHYGSGFSNTVSFSPHFKDNYEDGLPAADWSGNGFANLETILKAIAVKDFRYENLCKIMSGDACTAVYNTDETISVVNNVPYTSLSFAKCDFKGFGHLAPEYIVSICSFIHCITISYDVVYVFRDVSNPLYVYAHTYTYTNPDYLYKVNASSNSCTVTGDVTVSATLSLNPDISSFKVAVVGTTINNFVHPNKTNEDYLKNFTSSTQTEYTLPNPANTVAFSDFINTRVVYDLNSRELRSVVDLEIRTPKANDSTKFKVIHLKTNIDGISRVYFLENDKSYTVENILKYTDSAAHMNITYGLTYTGSSGNAYLPNILVSELSENTKDTGLYLLDTVSDTSLFNNVFLKAFLKISQLDTVYAVWEYSVNGVEWRDVYTDDALTLVNFKDWKIDSSLTPDVDNPDSVSDVNYVVRHAILLDATSKNNSVFSTDVGNALLCRADILTLPYVATDTSLVTPAEYFTNQYRLTLFSVKNDASLEGDANALYVKQIYSQKVFTFVTGSSTNFAKTLLTNAVKGDKLYYNNRIYSYGEPGFQNNILISDAGSYTTPLFNVADVKTSENVTVNGLIPWRDYLIATTTSSIHLISQADTGAYVKTVSSNTGVSDKDRRTCANTYNGIIFKSGSKIFALNPNAASSDDTIMNIVELSKPISNLLESIKYDSDSFAIGTSDEYILFMPDTDTDRTHCLRFSYDTKSWTYYVYDKVILSDYYRYENNTIHLFGTHDSTYTEYVFDSDVTDTYPDLATSIKGVVPYGDYLNAESLNVLDDEGNPKEITPTAIEFALDSGQKSDSIGVIKMYLETKLILAANTTDDKFSDFTVSVYVDGNKYPIREFKDAPLLNISPNTTFALGGPLNDSDADMSNVIRQAYFRHAGKGNSIRYTISGKSSYNFKLYGIHVRYRILPNKT